ncbi:MAG: glucosamine-6-phosphate isomerase [Armatimonadota bacterium]|nr:glucosamine-6-phosphate isomerase [Armatimonadota bacterium]
MDVTTIPAEDLGRGSPIRTEVLETDQDLYHDMARTMLNKVAENEELGRPTVFILPVGPVGQYRRMARICNLERISLRNLVCFNMDEYLDEDGNWLPIDHPLSFRGHMRRSFLDLMDPELAPEPDNVIFPDPNDLRAVPERMEALGGVDICYGGIGINGHIAFNEPPEPGEEMSVEEFAELPTRVLELSRETRTINSVTVADGNIALIPRLAVTVGMKECLSAREIRLYANRPWQRAVIRRVLHGEVTSKVPCSLVQNHPNASLTMTEFVSQPPRRRLA